MEKKPILNLINDPELCQKIWDCLRDFGAREVGGIVKVTLSESGEYLMFREQTYTSPCFDLWQDGTAAFERHGNDEFFPFLEVARVLIDAGY